MSPSPNNEHPQRSAGVPPALDEKRGQDARAPLGASLDTPLGAPLDTPLDTSLNTPYFDPFEDFDRHRHHLPHWQQGEVWQFVTWHLHDAMPKAKLDEWEAEKQAWLAFHPIPWNEATEREYHERFSGRVDKWLDAGHGSCLLRDPKCNAIVAHAIQHFVNLRYELGAFVVMPNHVHTLFRPYEGRSLDAILHSWKSFTAKQINKYRGTTGTVWQEDYWDRMIRNPAHLEACLLYIRENPAKAQLREGEYHFEERTPDVPPEYE